MATIKGRTADQQVNPIKKQQLELETAAVETSVVSSFYRS